MLAFAVIDYVHWDRVDNLPIWLSMAAAFGVIALPPQMFARRKQRLYREALAAYREGLSRAVEEIE